MSNYKMKPQDIQYFIDTLEYEIDYMNDELEATKRTAEEFKTLNSSGYESNRTVGAEHQKMIETIEELTKAIEVLSEMKKVVEEVLIRIDEKVGYLSDTHEFVYNEEECDEVIKQLKARLSNKPLKNITDFSAEYEDFCNKMRQQDFMDNFAIEDRAKKQEDNEKFYRNSQKMEDIQKSVRKLNREIEEEFNEIALLYNLAYGDLKGDKLIDEVLSEFDIELNLSNYGNVADSRVNTEIEIRNIVKLTGLSEMGAKELLEFYEDLVSGKITGSKLKGRELDQYFWGILSSGIGERYTGVPFLIVNGNYKDYLTNGDMNAYSHLTEELNDAIGIIDFQHMCATMSANSNWVEPVNRPANAGMGNSGDAIEGAFPQEDANSDALADFLQESKNTSTKFIELMGEEYKEGIDTNKRWYWEQEI